MPRAPRKKSYHHGDLRRALLDAALGILAKSGVHGLTLREVARKVGVTQGAPYHHFADKEAIIAAVAEEGFVELHAQMVVARDAVEPAGRLSAMGKSYVRFAVAHPAHFRVMFGKMVDVSLYPALHEAAERALATLVESIVAAQAAGIVRPGDPMELAMLAWATVHGLSMLWIEGAVQGPGCETMTIEGLAEAAVAMLARGIGT